MTHITVPDQSPFVELNVTSAQSDFAFAFTYFDKTDLRVTAGSIEIPQSGFDAIGTSGYEGGYPGGTIHLHAPVSSTTFRVWSEMPPIRINDFLEGTGIPARAANTELDRLTARQRDMRLKLERDAVITFANSTALTADQAGQLFTNQGQAGSLTLTLPNASAGLKYKFAVTAAHSLVVAAAASQFIVNAAASVATLTASTFGAFLMLEGIDGSTWAVQAQNGVWA